MTTVMASAAVMATSRNVADDCYLDTAAAATTDGLNHCDSRSRSHSWSIDHHCCYHFD